MKPLRALPVVDRTYRTGPLSVTVVRRTSTVERRKKLVRLLSELLDKPDTPDESGEP